MRGNPLCRGVTFSGGEPFAQAEALLPLAKMLKDAGYEVASYTGYTVRAAARGHTGPAGAAAAKLDVLIDGPFILAQRSLELNFRGSRNQRVLNVPESLKQGKGGGGDQPPDGWENTEPENRVPRRSVFSAQNR